LSFSVSKITRGYRRRCEDRVDVIPHPAGLVLVCADGAGGSGGGAEAADSILMWVRAHVTQTRDLRPATQWADLLAEADRQISFANGESTGVVVALWDDGLSGASVGDSAAWLVRDDGFDNLTAGQTHKPLLGSGRASPVAFERAGLGQSTLLLASDGLVKYAPPRRICELAPLPDLDAAAALLDLVRLRSGALQDDVAIVLCRRGRASAHEPPPRKRYTVADNGELLEEEEA
jgi:serine/threonine protein phosphatase PrpC